MANNYDMAQKQYDTHTWLASSAPKGDNCSTFYEHAGSYCDFSNVKQSLPAMCACVLNIPTLTVRYQAYILHMSE